MANICRHPLDLAPCAGLVAVSSFKAAGLCPDAGRLGKVRIHPKAFVQHSILKIFPKRLANTTCCSDPPESGTPPRLWVPGCERRIAGVRLQLLLLPLPKTRRQHLAAGQRGSSKELRAGDALPLRRPSVPAGIHPAGFHATLPQLIGEVVPRSCASMVPVWVDFSLSLLAIV